MGGDLEDGLRRQLLERTGGDAQRMLAALGRSDWDTIAALAHRLRGAAGALGLDALAGHGAAIEAACREKDVMRVREGVERLSRAAREGPAGDGGR